MRPSCSACHGRGPECPHCGDITAQARDWLAAKCPPSITGQGGHNAALKAACCLVKGFDLSPAQAAGLMAEWNASCSPPWTERELDHKLRSADSLPDTTPRGYLIWKSGAARPRRTPPLPPALTPPAAAAAEKPHFSLPSLQAAQLRGLFVDESWLAARSPIPPDTVTPSAFLGHLYDPGDRILTFTSQWSQGDYGARITTTRTAAWSRLAPYGGGPNTQVQPPFDDPAATLHTTAAPQGAWFLCQPVDGKWHLDSGSRDKVTGLPKHSRRSQLAVTRWRYLVLESDEAPTHLWLNLLVQLALPIAALYTSGGRSVHALVRVDAPSKPHFDALRASLLPVLSLLGADPAAITAVRLTRLPGVHRHGKTTRETIAGRPVTRFTPFSQPLLQRLLYLNPNPKTQPILTNPQRQLTPA